VEGAENMVKNSFIYNIYIYGMPMHTARKAHLLTQYCASALTNLGAVSYRMYFQQHYNGFYNQYTNYSNYLFEHY